MIHSVPLALMLQAGTWDLITKSGPIPKAVFLILLIGSLLSWTIIFAKWNVFRKAKDENGKFLRAFRKATGLESISLACEQFPTAPLVTVFDFGYEEVDRQVKKSKHVKNKISVERSLQLGVSEELTRLERHMNWLATTAAVAPFIGLFGTVWGIIDAFQALAVAGSSSLRAVGPSIGEALLATAMGLAAAIPAAIFYNYFVHLVKEIGARLDDFTLEFLNMTERMFEE
jgi:biopolymer transport protein TolQ